jgi:hypothetical protein
MNRIVSSQTKPFFKVLEYIATLATKRIARCKNLREKGYGD